MAVTPARTMAEIIDARQAGDFEKAAGNYAENAVIVVTPGKPSRGRRAIRDGFEALASAFSEFAIVDRVVVENGDVALHHCSWRATGPGASGEAVETIGRTADVLIRQFDDRWVVVIDNPWGTALVAG